MPEPELHTPADALRALDQTFALFRTRRGSLANQDTRKEDLWLLLNHVLDWLYKSEEAISRDTFATRDDYFEARAADPDGEVLGALIWLRGLATHQGSPIRAQIWRQVGNSRLHHATDGWPTRSSLPAGKKDNHQRDIFYERHLEGERLEPALLSARDCLVRLAGQPLDPPPIQDCP